MASSKTLNYTQAELDWYEKRIEDVKAYIDEHCPLSEIQDVTDTVPNAKGVPVTIIITRASDLVKLIMSMMKDMPKMIAELEELRSAKAAGKLETKGDKKVPGMMEQILKERNE